MVSLDEISPSRVGAGKEGGGMGVSRAEKILSPCPRPHCERTQESHRLLLCLATHSGLWEPTLKIFSSFASWLLNIAMMKM